MACWFGHTEAVEVLLDGGVATGDATGALFAAASNGHADTVKVFLKKLELQPEQRNAVLGTALGRGHEEVATILEKAGACPG